MEPVPDSIQAWLLNSPELRPLLDPNSTDEEFDDALEIHIADAIRWLEDNANNLRDNSEDSLSTTLAGRLSIRKLIEAHREMNSKGHVDITITILSTSRKRLGEAKLYGSYPKYERGIGQLVERYSTGRERSGYMFCYVNKSDIKDKMARLREECDSHLPYGQVGPASNSKSKYNWTFETQHTHNSGETLRVVHCGVNLHVQQPEKGGSKLTPS